MKIFIFEYVYVGQNSFCPKVSNLYEFYCIFEETVCNNLKLITEEKDTKNKPNTKNILIYNVFLEIKLFLWIIDKRKSKI